MKRLPTIVLLASLFLSAPVFAQATVEDDSGGAVMPPAPAECPGDFVQAKFIATAADYSGLGSLYYDADSRAGSVVLDVNGYVGLNGGTSDEPYSGGILTLRNGAGQLLEQWQMNRTWPPSDLDADGCRSWFDDVLGTTYQCWLQDPEDSVDGRSVCRGPRPSSVTPTRASTSLGSASRSPVGRCSTSAKGRPRTTPTRR